MITLRSSETDKIMELTENDHAKLKELYTESVQKHWKKVRYKRYGEVIVADMENTFNALIALDREKFEGK